VTEQASASMDEYSAGLLDAVTAAVPGWVERCIVSVARTQRLALDGAADAIAAAGSAAQAEVSQRLRALLETDVDDQRGNPLDVLRRSVQHATAVLTDLGARPVQRDEFAQRVFPDDIYGLSPAAFSDVSEDLVEPGIMWGAWKAKTVLDRRRSEGRL
jgi:hypothetical protein